MLLKVVEDKEAYGRSLVEKVPAITSRVATDFVESVNRAKYEILQDTWDMNHRGRTEDCSTTWLHNISFTFNDSNLKLADFLKDCVNADDILAAYAAANAPVIIKLSNPITLYFAIMLTTEQFTWLEDYLDRLQHKLRKNDGSPWNVINSHNYELANCPFPIWCIQRFYELLREDAANNQVLMLES